MTLETDRRTVLAMIAGSAAASSLPALPATAAAEDSCGPPTPVPNVVVRCHDGRKALFYNDLVRGKTVVIHFVSDSTDPFADPGLANLARAQEPLREMLGDRLGREVLVFSIVPPEHGGPQALAALAERCGAGPGWLFLTGEPAALELLRGRLFRHLYPHEAGHVHSGPPAEDCSRGLLRYGNDAAGVWGAVPLRTEPQWIAERIAWITPRQPLPAAAPRRRGPVASTVRKAVLTAVAVALLGLAARSPLQAQSCACAPAGAPPCAQAVQHPHMQCAIATSCAQTSGDTTTVCTGTSLFPESDPFLVPPGTNFLPTVYTNIFDINGREIPNTLPSTPNNPYNLHDGVPVASTINPISPTDDLQGVFKVMVQPPRDEYEELAVQRALQLGIDILEGNPVPNRAYSGLALLHYDGPEKLRKVIPVVDAQGKTVGGEVHVHQVWYDQHIESDTALLDPAAADGVPWTIVYTVDVLNRGEDDFSPFVMYFNGNTSMPGPGIGMDQSFFPMEDGTRTVFRIKMAPAEYYNLVYTWGWRVHPPRAQVIEKATKTACVQTPPPGTSCPTLLQWEQSVFGEAPRSSEAAKLAAIAKIGDLDPAKRMWNALRAAREAAAKRDYARVVALAAEGRDAYFDWRNRTKLPRGVAVDPGADLTLLYVNNTIYGQFTDGGLINFPRWQQRGASLKVTAYNGDYFEHGYQNVDFGGARGWENQFKSSVKVGGSGCWFTFGRAYWWMNMPGPNVFTVPAATSGKAGRPDMPGMHKFEITYNYEPSRRLRFYQFDPLHHDVAIFSVH